MRADRVQRCGCGQGERQARCQMERWSSVGRRGKVDMVDTWGGVRLSLGVGDGGGALVGSSGLLLMGRWTWGYVLVPAN